MLFTMPRCRCLPEVYCTWPGAIRRRRKQIQPAQTRSTLVRHTVPCSGTGPRLGDWAAQRALRASARPPRLALHVPQDGQQRLLTRPLSGRSDSVLDSYGLASHAWCQLISTGKQPGRTADELSRAVFAELAMKRARRAAALVRAAHVY